MKVNSKFGLHRLNVIVATVSLLSNVLLAFGASVKDSFKDDLDIFSSSSIATRVLCNCVRETRKSNCISNQPQDWILYENDAQKILSTDFSTTEKVMELCPEERECLPTSKLAGIIILSFGEFIKTYTRRNASRVIFCPGSIPPNLLHISLTMTEDVIVASEAVRKRSKSLFFELSHVKNRIVFQSDFFRTDSEMKSVKIHLKHVNDVYFNSNSAQKAIVEILIFSGNYLKLDKDFLTQNSKSSSSIIAKNVKRVHVYDSWLGDSIYDTCEEVFLFIPEVSNFDVGNSTVKENILFFNFSSLVVKSVKNLAIQRKLIEHNNSNSLKLRVNKPNFFIFKELIFWNTNILFSNLNFPINLYAENISIIYSNFQRPNTTKIEQINVAGGNIDLKLKVIPDWISFCQKDNPFLAFTETEDKSICSSEKRILVQNHEDDVKCFVSKLLSPGIFVVLIFALGVFVVLCLVVCFAVLIESILKGRENQQRRAQLDRSRRLHTASSRYDPPFLSPIPMSFKANSDPSSETEEPISRQIQSCL